MQFNYRYRYLVVILGGIVYVFKSEISKFEPPFLSFRAKTFLIGKSEVCPLTDTSGAGDDIDFDRKTFLLECEKYEYVYISGLEIFQFKKDDKITDYLILT